MGEPSGLHDAIVKVLSGPDSIDIDSLRAELVDSLDESLLDYRIVRRLPDIVEEYVALQAEVVKTALALMLGKLGALKAVMGLVESRVKGEILESEWCIPVVVRRSIGVKGHIAGRGAVICIRDVDEYIFLTLARVVEYIALQRNIGQEQAGKEQQ